MVRSKSENVDRRRFLKATAAGAAGFTVVSARSVAGTQANSRVRLGIIGSGGRGVWIGHLFQKHSATKVVALADVFDDRLDKARARLKVDARRCYKGLDAFHELLASDVDAVAVQSPPYFHPRHAVAAIDAGKHVFLAKPVAVDVPGCQAIVDAAERAADTTSVWVDLQTRVTPAFVEAARRVHRGDIGTPVCGQVIHHAPRMFPPRCPPGISHDERRLRQWVVDRELSGDIIVEQNVHMIDVANWFLGAHPVEASGFAARKARTDGGDCHDQYMVTFRYPGDVLVDFQSTQFVRGHTEMCVRLFGTEGTVEAHYGGRVAITGSRPWIGAANRVETVRGKKYERLRSTGHENMYTDGAVANIRTFIDAVRTGQPLNNTTQASESTHTSILGRSSAESDGIALWTPGLEEEVELNYSFLLS